MAEEKEVGKVAHFFGKISVAVIKLTDTLKKGDTVHIKGPNSDFTQTVDSMQIEHKNVEKAESGQSIGLKLAEPAREGDTVYKVEE
jgi:putative protease